MNKGQLANKFEKKNINILVQNYNSSKPHKDLDASNEFGTPNKEFREAAEYRAECRKRGVNRFLHVKDRGITMGEWDMVRNIRIYFCAKVHDYIKDYLGNPHIRTAPESVFETLNSNTKGIQKIVLHLTKEMPKKQEKGAYKYLSDKSIEYPNIKFLVLDQYDRGIKKLNNFELIKIS